jgi:TolA-binding protein
MATLENVKLLEAKVSKAVDMVRQLTGTSERLTEENKQLKEKIGTLQNQVNELEFAILGYKEDQQNIETGILSALNRLNQVEDSLDNKNTDSGNADSASAAQPAQNPPAQPSFNNDEMFHEQGYQGNGIYYPA